MEREKDQMIWKENDMKREEKTEGENWNEMWKVQETEYKFYRIWSRKTGKGHLYQRQPTQSTLISKKFSITVFVWDIGR